MIHGDDYGWGMGFGWLWMIVFWALVIAGTAYLVRAITRRNERGRMEEALSISSRRDSRRERSPKRSIGTRVRVERS
jgi:hypothetical protein